MQGRGGATAPGILFDSDMGRHIDAALALAMFHGLGRGRLIAVGISHPSLEAAAFAEIVARHYSGNAARNMPIGLAEEGAKLGDAPMLRVPLGMRNATGEPVYTHGIRDIVDTGEPAVVFRNALLSRQEQQAIVVLAGPATSLVRLLELPGAGDIVKEKVRLLVMAAGSFSGGAPERRVSLDVASARRLLAAWPSPIVAVGMEAAEAAPFPDFSIEAASPGAATHPIVPAYKAFLEDTGAKPGIPAPAALAALYASSPAAEYFTLSPTGTIEVGDDGRTRLAESPTGKHRYLILDPVQKQAVTEALVALITARPATGRGGRG